MRARAVGTSLDARASRVARAFASAVREDDVTGTLTGAQRTRRAALLGVTTCAALAYVGYFAAPLIADGTARSCAALARSRDGFSARSGAERARATWALGGIGGARDALLARGVVEACVELACREGMDPRARVAASAMVREAAEDARGAEALRTRRDALAACERALRPRRRWFGAIDEEDERLVVVRENMAATLGKL